MRKDLDLGKGDSYAKHSRNSERGKAGVNRAKRHCVKQNVENTDATAAPATSKHKKRFGIKHGKFCRWYKTKKGRDQAFADVEKSQRILAQTFKQNKGWASSILSQHCTKVER